MIMCCGSEGRKGGGGGGEVNIRESVTLPKTEIQTLPMPFAKPIDFSPSKS